MAYIALPSPMRPTTGRSSRASLTPTAAGRPNPSPPPLAWKKLFSSLSLCQGSFGIGEHPDVHRVILPHLPGIGVDVHDRGHLRKRALRGIQKRLEQI